MSKTYRRRGPEPWYVSKQLQLTIENYSIRVEWKYFTGKQLQRRKAQFHADGYITYNRGVPSKFVNQFCERPFRMACKQALHKQLQYTEEDIVFPKFVKNALWRYW